MSELTADKCEACRGGVPTLTDAELRELLPQVPGWRVTEVQGVKRIERTFEFPDFRTALAFTNEVAELAEREGHHPDIHLAWGKVRVETWTHAIQGLHRNDFILAAKTSELYTPAAKR
jgi:4a-hydroxytetrahydrobiopterin dehydratase